MRQRVEGEISAEMREGEDVEEISDSSFSPDDESTSEDGEPVSRKRPRRVVTVEGPGATSLSSQQPSDTARACTGIQSNETHFSC